MAFLKKHIQKVIMLMLMCLVFTMQARAQFFEDEFDDDGGPGGFDPPPDNDVPLDTYQWVMMFLAIGYGIYIFWKHYQKNRQVNTGSKRTPSVETALNNLTPQIQST